MSKRAANGRGTITQRSNGTWEARLSYVDQDTGTRKRLSLYAATQKAVLAKFDDAKDRIEAGLPPTDDSGTVAEWLASWRETSLAVSDRKQSTRDLYANLCRKHLEPAPFGTTRLNRLRPSTIEALILRLRQKGLSDSTIRSIYTVARCALDGAVRDGLLARNPAALVKRPGVERHEARHLSQAEVTALLKAAEVSRYHLALVLIANTGLRRGEVLGLTWERVDLDNATLRVTATLNRVGHELLITEPKTERARRTVPLSAELVKLLRKHRIAQKEEQLAAMIEWPANDLVFRSELGTPVEPRSLLRVVEAAAVKAKLTDVDVHTLRHSVAMAWLEGGTHIKAVSDLLGHSSIAITGDVYGHATDETTRAAVDSVSKSLGL